MPESAGHWLGLAPIAIGIKQLLASTDKGSRTQPESAWTVATITFANCFDNLAVYTPLFGRFSPWQVGLIAISFYLLLFLMSSQRILLLRVLNGTTNPQMGSPHRSGRHHRARDPVFLLTSWCKPCVTDSQVWEPTLPIFGSCGVSGDPGRGSPAKSSVGRWIEHEQAG